MALKRTHVIGWSLMALATAGFITALHFVDTQFCAEGCKTMGAAIGGVIISVAWFVAGIVLVSQ